MLEPNDRHHLLEVLRPPDGYQLDCAVGTTFSLDLLALLTVPLAFTLFDWEDEAGRPAADPMAVLEALRRYSDRIHIFCQSGRIVVPANAPLLFGYLEDSVFDVNAPRTGGIFHPKVWALRFIAPEEPVRYRILCLSRNLTFDQSWDTMLALEGNVIERKVAYAVNNPLGDFIAALPKLALQPIPERVISNIDRIQNEIRRVYFELPDGFDKCAFWPLGIEGYRRWPFSDRIDRLLVVSPFLSPEALQQLTEQGSEHVLVSRLDSLVELGKKDLAGFKAVYALNPMAEPEEPEDNMPEVPLDPETPLSGLHAKLYIAEDGWKAHLWTGSANATTAAFNANVEFLVELIGKKSAYGVKAILEADGNQPNFADLLQLFSPTRSALKPDPIQRQLENALRTMQANLAGLAFVARVEPGHSPQSYVIHLSSENTSDAVPKVEVQCWPITLAPTLAVPLSWATKPLATFGPLSFESLTAFFAFQLTAQINDRSLSAQFVLHIPLVGAPMDRRERLLRSMLQDRSQVMRFLMFILLENQAGTWGNEQSVRQLWAGPPQRLNASDEAPLFEALVQALHRDPVKIDHIARLVAELERTPEGQQLLPEGFQAIWQPIWEARQRLAA